MHRAPQIVMLAFAFALASGSVAAQQVAISELIFMSGCWKTAPGVSPEYRECYTVPKAGMIQGSSQTVKDGKTTFFEFATIVEEGGKIAYTPFLKGVRSVDFPLVKSTSGEVVFENLKHDFPQRIIYRK